MSRLVPALIGLTLSTMIACDVEETDPASVGAPLDGPVCDDTPLVTWETFGRGFVVTHCQGCHASTVAARRDAPPDIVFDSEEDITRLKSAIRDSAGSDAPRMPPNGGTTEEDRARLRAWLDCFAD